MRNTPKASVFMWPTGTSIRLLVILWAVGRRPDLLTLQCR